ncbi:MAG: hypothetical protein HY791_21385 [Deltaproteobacteria bacterium]|nr:hypothetical protein [Deltaproteobacteria bacterium]
MIFFTWNIKGNTRAFDRATRYLVSTRKPFVACFQEFHDELTPVSLARKHGAEVRLVGSNAAKALFVTSNDFKPLRAKASADQRIHAVRLEHGASTWTSSVFTGQTFVTFRPDRAEVQTGARGFDFSRARCSTESTTSASSCWATSTTNPSPTKSRRAQAGGPSTADARSSKPGRPTLGSYARYSTPNMAKAERDRQRKQIHRPPDGRMPRAAKMAYARSSASSGTRRSVGVALARSDSSAAKIRRLGACA